MSLHNKIDLAQTDFSNQVTIAYNDAHVHVNKSYLDLITGITINNANALINLSGTNTGDETQSTILTKLGGTAIIGIGTCSTASATAEKAVALSGFALAKGANITVTFTNANTSAIPTLNVNSTGAKSIVGEDGVLTSATNPAYFPAGSTVEFIYNGTYWVFKNKVITNYINGTSWYRQYSDGKIEQGGQFTQPSSSNSTTVTFLKSFTSILLGLSAFSYSPSSSSSPKTGFSAYTSYSLTTATINTTGCGSDGLTYAVDGNNAVVIWQACGY